MDLKLNYIYKLLLLILTTEMKWIMYMFDYKRRKDGKKLFLTYK